MSSTLTSSELVKSLRDLNPGVLIKGFGSSVIEFSETPKDLIYPKGYHYDSSNGMIVGETTESNLYDAYIAIRPDNTCW